VKRDEYLKSLFYNSNLPADERLREVYLDESYIHHHYHHNDDSIWDPNDDQDLMYNKKKVLLYCCNHGI
jgi:hypothetical protein